MASLGRFAVCDEDPAVRAFVADVGRSVGFEALEVLDGRQALATLIVGDVQLGFLDLSLPELSGFEVAHRIQKAQLHKTPILVAMIGDVSLSDQTLSTAVGFEVYLRKPISAEQIAAVLTGRHSDLGS